MRTIIRWAQSNRGCWAISCLILAYFLFVYRPLNARTKEKESQLRQTWNRIETIHRKKQAPDRSDFNHISQSLKRLAPNMKSVKQTLLSRIEIDSFYHDKSLESLEFQIVDYQSHRQEVIESLDKLAQTRQSQIPPSVFEGFPAHHSDLSHPNYLWIELLLTKHLLQSMICADVESISKLSVQRQRTPPIGANLPPPLIPVISEVQFVCDSGSLFRLLLMLPLRAEEIQKELNIAYPANKPSLYVDQILIQKNSPEKPARVSVWMKIAGFIPPLSTQKAAETKDDRQPSSPERQTAEPREN